MDKLIYGLCVVSLLGASPVAVRAAEPANIRIFAAVSEQVIEPAGATQWQLSGPISSRYPPAWVKTFAMGCVVSEFGINQFGRAQGIKITAAIKVEADSPLAPLSAAEAKRSATKMIADQQWQPVDPGLPATPEQRVMRFNFCLSNRSTEDAEEACARLGALPCG